MIASSSTKNLVDCAWNDVVAWLPGNIDTLAFETGGLKKRREIRDGKQLLRLALAYGVLNLSLRSTAAWAATQGVAELSDVAVLKRLRSAGPFLEALLLQLVAEQVRPTQPSPVPWKVRLTDSTTLSHPGSSGADWRVHVGFDPVRGKFDAIELTDGKGGEHLGRIHPGPGDLVVADRGYAHSNRVVEAREAGAHVLVRIGHNAVPMWTMEGTPLDPLAYARRKRLSRGRPPRVEDVAVTIKGAGGKTCPARLIIVRKSLEATRREQDRVRREASRKGKTPTERTLDAAAFAFLLTTVPVEQASARTLAELYRVRWQVEIAFKRWKSLLDLDQLRARDPELARTSILANLLAAVFADKLSRSARAFSP